MYACHNDNMNTTMVPKSSGIRAWRCIIIKGFGTLKINIQHKSCQQKDGYALELRRKAWLEREHTTHAHIHKPKF